MGWCVYFPGHLSAEVGCIRVWRQRSGLVTRGTPRYLRSAPLCRTYVLGCFFLVFTLRLRLLAGTFVAGEGGCARQHGLSGVESGGGGGVLIIMHGRSRMMIRPCRTPAMPGRKTSCFHGPGRLCLLRRQTLVVAPGAKRLSSVLGESHREG